jgi:hypothetical protein
MLQEVMRQSLEQCGPPTSAPSAVPSAAAAAVVASPRASASAAFGGPAINQSWSGRAREYMSALDDAGYVVPRASQVVDHTLDRAGASGWARPCFSPFTAAFTSNSGKSQHRRSHHDANACMVWRSRLMPVLAWCGVRV